MKVVMALLQSALLALCGLMTTNAQAESEDMRDIYYLVMRTVASGTFQATVSKSCPAGYPILGIGVTGGPATGGTLTSTVNYGGFSYAAAGGWELLLQPPTNLYGSGDTQRSAALCLRGVPSSLKLKSSSANAGAVAAGACTNDATDLEVSITEDAYVALPGCKGVLKPAVWPPMPSLGSRITNFSGLLTMTLCSNWGGCTGVEPHPNETPNIQNPELMSGWTNGIVIKMRGGRSYGFGAYSAAVKWPVYTSETTIGTWLQTTLDGSVLGGSGGNDSGGSVTMNHHAFAIWVPSFLFIKYGSWNSSQTTKGMGVRLSTPQTVTGPALQVSSYGLVEVRDRLNNFRRPSMGNGVPATVPGYVYEMSW